MEVRILPVQTHLSGRLTGKSAAAYRNRRSILRCDTGLMVRKPMVPPKRTTRFARGDKVILHAEVMSVRVDDMGREWVSVDIDGYGMAYVTLTAEHVEKAE